MSDLYCSGFKFYLTLEASVQVAQDILQGYVKLISSL